MSLASLRRSLIEAWEVPRDLLLGRYPRFVRGGPLDRGEIPVFVFHDAEPESFARALDHLQRNRYVTLSIDEYLRILRGQAAPPPRAVLLTFDDGRGSVWTVAAPLLKRRGMRAACFLVPGRVPSHEAGPTWDDALAGHADKAAVLERQAPGSPLMSWAEIAALARSGTFEFQSHTFSHARVHTAPELAGFATPSSRLGYPAFDQPLVRSGGRDLLGAEVPLGTPLFRSAPRTSDAQRFFEDEAARAACVDRVAREGGARFFEQPDWRRQLHAEIRDTRVSGRPETPDEQAAHVRRELVDARARIERHTSRPAVHLCYPWHSAGTLARKLAAEAGYVTAFCGKVEGVPITRIGGDLLRIARLGEDYLELLPGDGRGRLADVLRRKYTRRFRGARG